MVQFKVLRNKCSTRLSDLYVYMSVIRPIYMFAYLLLDPFQLYLERSVVFGLSIYTATANSCTVGKENVLLGFFVWG